MKFSIGFAKDIHNLKKDKKRLILGGFEILNNNYSIDAHSDGDIILHAISSSLLGAMNLSITLGDLFSDDDIKNKNLNSLIIAKNILLKIKEKKYSINNIDITLVCEKIILKEYLEEIRKSLITIFKTKNIGIKCTRYEDKKNFQIECNVICSLFKNKENNAKK